MTVSFNNLQSIGTAQVSMEDIEATLLTAQSQRASLLEGQLKAQLDDVQKRNIQMGDLNNKLNSQRSEVSTMEVESANLQTNLSELQLMKKQLQQVLNRDPNNWTGLSYGWDNDNAKSSHEMLARISAQGLTGTENARDIDGNGTMDANSSTLKSWLAQIDSKIAQSKELPGKIAEAKAGMDNLKTEIDSLSNSQQMDMLRLQSLSNKRNEAFDLMTNFIKKMQDSRSSITSNMR